MSSEREEELNHFIAGAVSGAVATGVTAPLELVKTVLQSGAKQTNAVTILKEQVRLSGLKGCFRGLSPSLMGIIPHSGLYFALYAPAKKLCSAQDCSEGVSSAIAAMAAGGIANVVTNPIWVVKTKMSTKPVEYPTMARASRKILQQEGFRGFKCGMGASLLGVSHVVLQFPMYERLKRQFGDSDSISTIASASVVSKLAASSVTYPLDVIRTQMQLTGETGWSTALKLTGKIWKSNGMSGFFRGFNANVVKSVPSTVITLCMYEALQKNEMLSL